VADGSDNSQATYLIMPFYNFCCFRSVAVDSVYKLQLFYIYYNISHDTNNSLSASVINNSGLRYDLIAHSLNIFVCENSSILVLLLLEEEIYDAQKLSYFSHLSFIMLLHYLTKQTLILLSMLHVCFNEVNGPQSDLKVTKITKT